MGGGQAVLWEEGLACAVHRMVQGSAAKGHVMRGQARSQVLVQLHMPLKVLWMLMVVGSHPVVGTELRMVRAMAHGVRRHDVLIKLWGGAVLKVVVCQCEGQGAVAHVLVKGDVVVHGADFGAAKHAVCREHVLVARARASPSRPAPAHMQLAQQGSVQSAVKSAPDETMF